ncbi:hypothetical protein EMCRGX_G025010 [Ephydatia muelleri]
METVNKACVENGAAPELADHTIGTGKSSHGAKCPVTHRPTSPGSDSAVSTNSEGDGAKGVKEPNAAGDRSADAANEAAVEGTDASKESVPSDEVGAFNVTLILPGVLAPVDAMVSSRDTVHDLLQFALEKPECCYRTCLSVRLDGKQLDDFLELASVENMRDGARIELVEEPYTQRDVRVHVQRLKDLLSANPVSQSFTCTDGMTLSLLAAITLKEPEGPIGDNLKEDSYVEPPEYGLPHGGDYIPPLTPFLPSGLDAHFKVPECLQSLSYSAWNPPPPPRKLKGDLLYIDLVTLEGQEFHITACPSGFYINKSTGPQDFNPEPKKSAPTFKHLVGLLQQISPLFKKNFIQRQKFGEKRHPFEVLPVPYPVVPWLSPQLEHRPVAVRIDDSRTLKAAPDELLVGQLRDWNEEFQVARELPVTTASLKMYRDRTVFKIHSDYVAAATRGAMAVVDGYIPPLNPADEDKFRMYLWNNIFFSLAFDGRDHFKQFGGDEAAHAAARADLNGVAMLERMEERDLHTLGTVIVDYRGYRIVAQSIIPGILQREQESSAVYGSIDAGKTITTNKKFEEMLKKISAELHIREHRLITEKDEEVVLPSSLEVKGIIGTDGRHYALDLFRLLPPDPNYMGVLASETSDGSEPRVRHKLSIFRPELIETFVNYRYMMFLQLAKEKTSKLKVVQDMQKEQEQKAREEEQKTREEEGQKEVTKDQTTSTNAEAMPHAKKDITTVAEAKPGCPSNAAPKEDGAAAESLAQAVQEQLMVEGGLGKDVDASLPAGEGVLNGDEKTTPPELKSHPEVMAALYEAAQEAGSSVSEDFDIRFNVDILSPGVRHGDSPEVLEKDRKLVTDSAAFLVGVVIPRMVRDCVQLVATPVDGDTLKQVLHERGINMRYLGKVAEVASSRDDLDHIVRLCVMEMVVRVARRRYNQMLQETTPTKLSAAIVHFLNCLFGEVDEPKEHQGTEETGTKKKSKKRKGQRSAQDWLEVYLKLSTQSLWSFHCGRDRLALQIQAGLPKLFCKKTGTQLFLREYDLFTKQPFTEDDVISMFPVVKHTNFRPTEGVALLELGQVKLRSGQVRLAHDLLLEALQLFIRIYGPMHLDIANCYRSMAKVCYILGDTPLALGYQHKATLIMERVMGVDHSSTVAAYINLALYCHDAKQTGVALRLLYRARYLLVLMYGDGHPELAACDTNLALILHSLGDHLTSVRYLKSALGVHERYSGKDSLQTAIGHHLVARAQSFIGDFRAALQHEKAAHIIYSSKLGPDHEKTKESSECLKQLTERAVTVQKTINEMTAKGKSSSRALGDLPGSWKDVATMLNGLEGTRYVAKGQSGVAWKRAKEGKQPSVPSSAQP